MFEEKSQRILRLMVVLDIVFTAFAFLLAYWIRTLLPEFEAKFFSHLAMLPLLLAFLIFFLSNSKAYQSPRSASLLSYGLAVFRSVAISFALLLTLLFLLEIQYVSRWIIGIFSVIDFFAIFLIRICIVEYFKRSIRRGENFYKLLIIGTGERSKDLSRALRQRTEWGIDIIGHLDPDPAFVGQNVLGADVIGTVADITMILKKHVIDEVILAIPRSLIEDVESIAYACEEEAIKLRFMADVFNLKVARWSLTELGEIPLLTLEPVALDETKLFIKRFMDLTLTLLSMPILLPIMGIIAIAIKIDSKGPVFFLQERVGLRKRLFKMIKFRSMYIGSEEKLKEIEHLNEAEGPIFKIANDPRVTRVGKFMRRTSLDEFPQLFNVIAGHMSLVGPRPMSIRDVDLFDKGIQRKRFSVKPGCTCIWQISGRSNLPFSKWLELDLEYIENWSLFLDVKILFKTPFVLIKGTGAV